MSDKEIASHLLAKYGPLLTHEETAGVLRIDQRTLTNWIAKRKYPALTGGGRHRVFAYTAVADLVAAVGKTGE